jgi:hypothetical protein
MIGINLFPNVWDTAQSILYRIGSQHVIKHGNFDRFVGSLGL